MIGIDLRLDGDGCWPDLAGKPGQVIHLGNGAPMLGVAVLPRGTSSGRPSVMIRIDLPDGTTVVAETTARLFVTEARAIQARYPEALADG